MSKDIGGLVPLLPSGTNSTFFTACCRVAICDDQDRCPVCKKLIIGYDKKPGHERHQARWNHAYRRPNHKRWRQQDEDARWRELDKLSQEGGWTPWNWEQR